MKNHPFDVQHISRGCFAIEIDGEWHQYSETAEIVKGVQVSFRPPQWVIDHKEKQANKRQPIKPKTDDEFNNAQQVAYGSYIQVEPLKDE